MHILTKLNAFNRFCRFEHVYGEGGSGFLWSSPFRTVPFDTFCVSSVYLVSQNLFDIHKIYLFTYIKKN